MIPVYATHYTATMQGRVFKFVPCENCQTEYVYVLEREGFGGGTSMYMLNETGAKHDAVAGAEESLRECLANDFDPVPCPACGHYQKYMFPKLLETRSVWGTLATLAVVLAGCVSAVSAAFWGIEYLQLPTDLALWRLAAACAVLAVAGLAGSAIWALKQARVRRFNPIKEDQQSRIAKGKSRAVTRAQFDAQQQKAKLD